MFGDFSGPHDTVQCSLTVEGIECEEDSGWAVTIYPGIGSLWLGFGFFSFVSAPCFLFRDNSDRLSFQHFSLGCKFWRYQLIIFFVPIALICF